jgi:hypothetical protein
MRKFISILFGLFLITAKQPNEAFSFSITKPVNSSEIVNYVKGREFVKLSFKEFVTLTGHKANLLNKILFSGFKNKLKNDLRKNPNLTLTQYYPKALRTTGKIFYIVILLIMLFLIVIGVALKK